MPRFAHGSVATPQRLQDPQRDLASRTADIDLGFAVAGPAALQDFDRLFLKLRDDQASLLPGRPTPEGEAGAWPGHARPVGQKGGGHMKRLVVLALVVVAMGLPVAALADTAPARTFVAVLSEEEEVPACAAATNAAGGLFIAHVVDEASGTVEFKLVANNLPGSPVAAHIHVAPKGDPGPVVQNLGVDPGAENGVVRAGTFTNPALLAAIRANPANYYINVHTDVCPLGVVRGQLGEQGPATTN